MKILLIEDDESLASAIREYLKSEDILVEVAQNFQKGQEKAMLYEYDCILLDLTLPGGDGMEILKTINNSPVKNNVIIISARGALEDKITGLESGADDFLPKPFHLAELNARIKAVVRRKLGSNSNEISIGEIRIDLNNRKVFIGQQEIQLFRKEFDLLYYFAINKNRLLTKSAIAEYVWGDHYEDADNLDFVYYQIKNLRKKIT
ncbi:MAG: winged helix family two component transcriptional regulator [Candidatus Parvibacillus calidus]|nr:MAG: winged helix family two component transcriptional regulator [Candidatus Parvibacillus calidus]